MCEDKIKTIRGKIEYAENIVNMPIETLKTFEKAEELSLARQELSFLTVDKSSIDKSEQEKIVNELSTEIQKTQAEIDDLDLKMKTGKRKYLAVKSEPVSCCSLCGQVIKSENKSIAIKNMKLELEEMFLRKTKLEQNIVDTKSKLAVEKCKLYALDGTSETEKEKQIANIEIQVNNLKQERLEIERYNNSIFAVYLRYLELSKYTYSDDKYIIFPAPSVDSLKDEGEQQGNCVGYNYLKPYMEGKTEIFFIRKLNDINKSFITLEYKNGNVAQKELPHHSTDFTDEHNNFIDAWLIFRNYIDKKETTRNKTKKIITYSL